MIDVTATQTAVAATGFSPGRIDGGFGRLTMTALLAQQAGRQPDAMLRALGLAMAQTLPRSGILDTPQRLAEFLAQTAHETRSYQTFEESMRYSAKRLMEVWPSRFPTLASALPFAWDPTDPDLEDVALANKVYGGRMGNERNGTDDNDGWDNRGGGLLQHTGFEEYALLRQRLSLTSEQVHTDPTSMVLAAVDYWGRRKVNSLVDRGDYRGARRAVNGGVIGFEDVAGRRARSLRVIR